MATRDDLEVLRLAFPALGQDVQIKSEQTDDYNCIAFAAGETHRPWWPIAGRYWPIQPPPHPTVQAFRDAFELRGFAPCTDENFESGCVKLAIYAIGDEVQHMARLISPAWWHSKLGPAWDVWHKLRGLEGAQYGSVVEILRKGKKKKGEKGRR